jgi:protein TonB
MNRAAPPMPEVPSPFASGGPVIAAAAELAPSGVGFVMGRAAPAETMPVASAGGSGDGGNGGSRSGGRGAGGGVGVALLYAPRPVYPAAARTAGIEGATVLRMEVQPDGSVGAVQVVESSGFDILDEAAVAAVRKWKFVPWKAEGRPVAAYVEQLISFRLNRG